MELKMGGKTLFSEKIPKLGASHHLNKKVPVVGFFSGWISWGGMDRLRGLVGWLVPRPCDSFSLPKVQLGYLSNGGL